MKETHNTVFPLVLPLTESFQCAVLSFKDNLLRGSLKQVKLTAFTMCPSYPGNSRLDFPRYARHNSAYVRSVQHQHFGTYILSVPVGHNSA